jgi:hypothetical protein
VAESTVVLDYPDVRSANCLADQLYAVKKRIEKNTRPYRCFRRHEIFTELERHGFYVRQSRGQFFIPMAMHRLAGSLNFTRMTESVARAVGLTGLFGSPIILQATAGPDAVKDFEAGKTVSQLRNRSRETSGLHQIRLNSHESGYKNPSPRCVMPSHQNLGL